MPKIRHINAEQAFELRLKSEEMILEKMDKMTDKSVVEFLEFMDLDEAMGFICLIPIGRRKRIVKRFNKSLEKKSDILHDVEMTFVEHLMDFNYVEIDLDDPIEMLVAKVKTHEQRVGSFPTILVMRKGLVLGSIPGHFLSLVEDPKVKVGTVVMDYLRNIPSVDYRMKKKDIIEKFKKGERVSEKAVVIDEKKRVIGVLYVDALMSILEDKAAEALYDFAGVDDEERAEDSFKKKFRLRYKWLLVNLGTTFLAAGVVSLLGDVLSREVLLASFIPVVSGMGGNAATQTLAVMVRTLSLEGVENIGAKKLLGIWKNEAMAGAMNGLLTGGLVAVIATVFGGNPRLGVVVGVAVLFNLFVSSFFGTMVPYFMKKAGKDPATSATIFITTATDVFGFIAFLGLANLWF
jgi:magnesium transporter